MAKRNQLKNVASGLLGYFGSRNNDISGYWGMGVMSLYAEMLSVDSITFDLIKANSAPHIPELNGFVMLLSTKFFTMVEQAGLSSQNVTQANITVNFNQPFDEKLHYWRSALGKPYINRIEITHDLGGQYFAVSGGNCFPHSNHRETQRTRDHIFVFAGDL